MFGEMPNLVPLVKAQELVFDGKMTLHQIGNTNVATRGEFIQLLEGCSEQYERYKKAMSQEAFFSNAFCGALVVCPAQLKKFAQCINQRSAHFNETKRRAQLGQPPLTEPPPVCKRVKQELEQCAVKFSSSVLRKSLDTV